jgi:hypothetical protein
MKEKRLPIGNIFLMFLLIGAGFTLNVASQEAFVSAGINVTANDGSVSSSTGQLLCTTVKGNSGTVYHGIQLPFDISVVTGNRDTQGILLECIVYPNPTSDAVKLNIKECRTSGLSYQLLDVNGKMLSGDKIENDETTIFMQQLPASVYFVKIMEGRQEIKVFKIVKN